MDWSHSPPGPAARSLSPLPWRAPGDALLVHPGCRAAPGPDRPSLPPQPGKALNQSWPQALCPTWPGPGPSSRRPFPPLSLHLGAAGSPVPVRLGKGGPGDPEAAPGGIGGAGGG